MKNTLLLFAAFSLALASWNCGSDKSGDSNAPSSASAGEVAPPEGETPKSAPLMRVRVDDLRVRKGPGKNAEVVGELKEGQVVEYLGEASRELEEVTLRGEKVKAPWMRVKLPDGGEGWVFGGALEDEQVASNVKSTGGTSAYQKYISSLPKGSCESMVKAVEKLKQDFSGADAAAQDEAIRVFYAHYQTFIVSQQDYIFGVGENEGFDLLGYNPDKKPLPKKVKAKSDEWKTCGIYLEFPEGMATPMEDPNFMASQFGNMGSAAMQEYLKRMKTDLDQGFSADAGLTITPQEFADRIIFWQQFKDKHPNFQMMQGMLPSFHEHIAHFMTGLDNTPAFDWGGDNKLYPEWKAAYESVMSKVPNSEAGKAIKEYYALLKENGWARTQKVIDHSTKYYGQHAGN